MLRVVLNSCFSGKEQLAMCLECCTCIPFGGSCHHRQSSGIAAIVPPMIYIVDAVMQLNLVAWSDSGSLMPMAFPPSRSMVIQRHISSSEQMMDHTSSNFSVPGPVARLPSRAYPAVWWCFNMLSDHLGGTGCGGCHWGEIDARRSVRRHTFGFGLVARWVGAPPTSGMFIAMKYGGLEVMSESAALSCSRFPFDVR